MTSGILRGIEDGWFMGEIAEAAFTYQIALEKGDKKVVGVNVHTSGVDDPLEILRVSHEVETEQVRELGTRKAQRDEAEVAARLKTLVEVAAGEGNTIPPMLDAIRAEATLGEVCGALRDLWGSYTEPPQF
jgi:methylmalonyl-CoA mutase N-terminal domain/subunit